MENTLSVAKVLYKMYGERYGSVMDEMKMHKLMYFAQRESLMNSKQVLFQEDFYGWKFGPVLKSVRSEYMQKTPFASASDSLLDSTKQLLRDVLARYGQMSSWTLSRLSHDEFSWKTARKGLNSDENGDVKMTLDTMMLDAARELMNRKNLTLG